MINRW